MGVEGLIVALGWSIDDFISECRDSSTEVLEETLCILESPPTEFEDPHLTQKSGVWRQSHSPRTDRPGALMSKRIEKDGKFYRMRRGVLVEIPREWVNKVTTPQTINRRPSKALHKHRKAMKHSNAHGFPETRVSQKLAAEIDDAR